MWPFFNFEKTWQDLAWAVRSNEKEKQLKLIKSMIRNRRTSVKKLVKMLESHLFDADLWIKESDFANDLLVLLSRDSRTRPLVIKTLQKAKNEGGGDLDFSVSPDVVLREIGA
jgi:protease II